MLDQQSILQIKALFAEEIFRNPRVLQLSEIARESLIIYDCVLKCLQCCRTCRVTDCCIDLGQTNVDQVVKLCFTIDNTRKVLIKVLHLRNEGVLVLNCLTKFDQQDICSIRIREPMINERLDDFIQRCCSQICNELIPRLVNVNVGLGQTPFVGDIYGQQGLGFNEQFGMRSGLQGMGPQTMDMGMVGMGRSTFGQDIQAPFRQSLRGVGGQMDYQDPYFRRSVGNIGQQGMW